MNEREMTQHNDSVDDDISSRYPIVITLNGTVRSPFIEDGMLIAIQTVSSSVGLPLNVFMALVILRLKRLRSKPRNIFLLGIFISNVMSFALSLFEVGHYFLPGNQQVCQVFVAILGIPQHFLLSNTFLSLLDRYCAIRDPIIHRTRITGPRIAVILILTFICVVLINKFVFISRLVPLECGIRLIERQVMGVAVGSAFFLCITARIAVYLQTRRILYDSRPWEQDGPADEDHHRAARVGLGARLSNRTVLRMEMEATKTLVVGVTSMIVLQCPLMIFVLLMSLCRAWYPAGNYCSRYSWLSSYLYWLTQLYGIHHPAVYLAWSPEFSGIIKYQTAAQTNNTPPL